MILSQLLWKNQPLIHRVLDGDISFGFLRVIQVLTLIDFILEFDPQVNQPGLVKLSGNTAGLLAVLQRIQLHFMFFDGNVRRVVSFGNRHGLFGWTFWGNPFHDEIVFRLLLLLLLYGKLTLFIVMLDIIYIVLVFTNFLIIVDFFEYIANFFHRVVQALI